jgi:hypothetical protein
MAVSMYRTYSTPGVYLESQVPGKEFVLETGIPVFVGLVRKRDMDGTDGVTLAQSRKKGVFRVEPVGRVVYGYSSAAAGYFPMFTSAAAADDALGFFTGKGFLGAALNGFFGNGGRKCYVHPVCYDDSLCVAHAALSQALDELVDLDGADLIAVPDLMWLSREDPSVSAEDVLFMQSSILEHCGRVTGRFAVLDTFPGADTSSAVVQRRRLKNENGALYYPFLKVTGKGSAGEPSFVPPCGHVCGIYALSDNARGVHKAPANEEIQGITDVETVIGNSEQDQLNPENVNCIRPFPGRGIRVWGARTLSGDPEWTYVNVRRLFLTFGRWLDGYMADLVFEPNDERLWNRITRDITLFLNRQFLAGALKGEKPSDAFYVVCDSRTNTRETRDLGRVVAEIGIAPASPCEFIVIRIVHTENGTQADGGDPVSQNATPSDSAVVASLPDVEISHIEYDVPGPDVRGEYAVILNRGAVGVELGNWSLMDLAGHVYTFPMTTLAPGAVLRIWTGKGTDTTKDLFWGMGHAVWNNSGDQAVLRDRMGRTVSTYRYVGKTS